MKKTRKTALGDEIVFEVPRQKCGAKRTYDLTRALVTDSVQLGVRPDALMSTAASNPFAGSLSYTTDWLIKAPPVLDCRCHAPLTSSTKISEISMRDILSVYGRTRLEGYGQTRVFMNIFTDSNFAFPLKKSQD